MVVCSLVEINNFTATHCLHLYCEDWGKGLINNARKFLSHYVVSNQTVIITATLPGELKISWNGDRHPNTDVKYT